MTARSVDTLRDDNRGAIMMTGLFMAFFLVGALWFVIGIGDAIIFRDRMQEAADHAAFTSAALHAKGMNFISAVNLIMLVLVVVHIVLGIIHDLLLAACLLTGAGCIPYVPARTAYHGYAQVMKPTFTVLSWAEKVAAWGYPWIGSVKGLQVGLNYGNQGRVENLWVIPMSPSNIPGLAGTGLPVGAMKFDYLCLKVASIVTDFGIGVAESVFPGWLKRLIDLPGGTSMGKVKRLFKNLMGSVIQTRYCNSLGQGGKDPNLVSKTQDMVKAREAIDRENEARAGRNRDNRRNGNNGPLEEMIPNFDINRTAGTESMGGWNAIVDPGFDRGWGNDGPMIVSAGAGNGTLAHQVWAVNVNPKYRDTNERRVSIPGEVKDRNFAVDSDQGALGYAAQAEFYFDCTEGWGDPKCNEDNNATFAIKWRARLHQTEIPNLLGLVLNYGFNSVTGRVIGVIDKAIGDKLKGMLGDGPVASLGIKAIKNWVLGHIYGLQGTANDKINEMTNPNTPDLGIYH